MLRHIWTLCSKTPSLWADWCHSNLLKGKCFWEIKTPNDCSWTWRKLLNLRVEASALSHYKVGNGKSISLWFSNWHPLGPLLPKYGPRLAYDAGKSNDAKVACIVGEGSWKWPFPCSWQLREIILKQPPKYLPNPNDEDKFIWLASKDGLYSSAKTWNAIRTRNQKVPWHRLVWFTHHIPRHSFILWIAIQERLSTRDRMNSWGMNVDPSCVLCNKDLETMDHLFFKCPFSANLRKIVLEKCLINKPTQPWKHEVCWATGKLGGKHIDSTIRKLAWASMIYHLWRERNARIFKQKSSPIGSIVQQIGNDVRIKLSHSKMTNVNVSLASGWGVPL